MSTDLPVIPASKSAATSKLKREPLRQHIVEIVSDSGEGAQSCGQIFATVSAKMGNGVWTVELIPAEIEPPARSRAGASGNRIRIGAEPITNAGDSADIVIAFNEQVLYSRVDANALKQGTIILLEKVWSKNPDPDVCEAYAQAVADFKRRGYVVVEVPMEEECLKYTENPRRGKNMWALGLLGAIYDRDMEIVRKEISRKFNRKGAKVVQANLDLVEAGYQWGLANLKSHYTIPPLKTTGELVVMNGNQAAALGAMAAGIEMCSMYPITPATSVSHFLAGCFEKVGGFVHQAEDEIAAIGFALGASYAGKTAMTVTSGPGLALKTEFIGLSIMAEIPLVIVVVQRGGPSTGLPTKVEQGDLMAALYAAPGDAPKIIMAPATIEECFHFMVTARQLAEDFRGPVIVLTDANLATGQQLFPRPKLSEDSLSLPVDQSPWDSETAPYEWDPQTGLSPRSVPGQRGGEYVLTGLTHDKDSHVAYESHTNQETMILRSRKLATFQKTLKEPKVHGDAKGELLVIGWGSTLGTIEEAVDRVRTDGGKVSSLHLRFLSPFEPGIKKIMSGFKQVMTVEINYGDDSADTYFDEDCRRHAQLAKLLRAQTLVDVDSWSRVPGSPLPPEMIEAELRSRLGM